jgi:type IX secretion system PorP/SprF family membrane protein
MQKRLSKETITINKFTIKNLTMRKLSIKMMVAAAIMLCSVLSYGQQEAHYTQFMYNKILLNPGFAGARRTPSVSALYRNQWIGYGGHPTSYLVSFDAALGKNRLGTGLVLHRQTEGVITRSAANLALSYDIINTKETTLRVGLSGTIREFRFDLLNPDVYIKDRTDQSLNVNNPKIVNANVGAGIYFDNKTYYIGLSLPNLMKNPISLGNNTGANLLATEKRHIYVMAGGFFKLFDNNDLHLKPAIMYKYVPNAPFSLDANLSVMFQKKIMVGGSYRFGGKFQIGDTKSGGGDSIDLLAFMQATDQLGIGLSYDFTLSQLAKYTNGSIELVARYDFAPSTTKHLRNPRYFF